MTDEGVHLTCRSLLTVQQLEKNVGIVDELLSDLTFPGGREMIEIKPYRLEEKGRNVYAECYPYFNDRPVPEIAHCRYCTLFNSDENEICHGWKDAPQDAPLFCGPVCPKFDLVTSKWNAVERKLIMALYQEKVFLPC